MKNKIFNGVIVVAILVLAYFQFIKNEKTAYIEVNVLLSEYQEMKDAKAEFEKKAANWQSNTDSLIKHWENDIRLYEKERASMTIKERQLKEEILKNRQNQLIQYREAMALKAQEEEQKLTQAVLLTVNEFVKEYGERKGYEYILGANGSGNILYAKEANNVTEEVIKLLNKRYQEEGKD